MMRVEVPWDDRVGIRPPGVWIGALGCFALAAATGALFRYGMLAGLPEGLALGNLRHAHSHLMYFGWATPALMALIAARLAGRRPPAAMAWIPWITWGAGLLAYFPFLLFGYSPVVWAGRRLPLATMAAGLNILVWYAYAGAYLWLARRCPHPARPWWDLGVFFLTLSSLGAWGRAAMAFLRVGDPFWADATVHFFLDLFADGWLVPSLIGMAIGETAQGDRRVPPWTWWAIALGTPGVFLLTMPPAEVPSPWRALGGIGGGMVATALLAIVGRLLPAAPWTWRIPLAFLGVRALAMLGLGVPAVAAWAMAAGLRIPYLHLLLLGFATLGLMAAARATWGARAAPGFEAMALAVGFLLLSLIPLTGLWPPAWGGRWTLGMALVGALLPTGAAMGMIGAALFQGRPRVESVRTAGSGSSFGGPIPRD